MMRTIILLFMTCIVGLAQEKGIPSDSLDLMAKLQQFEKAEREKAEMAIFEKRQAVIKILEEHLVRETKSGNLDAALQLKNTIAGIKAAPTISEIEIKEKSGPQNPVSNSFILAGSAWTAVKGNLVDGGVIEFLDDGAMKVVDPANQRTYGGWRYRVEGTDFYITPSNGDERPIRMSKNNTKMEIDEWGEFERRTN